jgi:hypothetical protein
MTQEFKEWPENWKELIDNMQQCDRCGSRLMPKLYCLSNEYPNIEVCHMCSDAYHEYIKKFVYDVLKRKRERS